MDIFHSSNLKNTLYIFIGIIVMFMPVVLAFTFNFSIFTDRQYFTLSIYGLYIVIYILIQMVFSYLNKRKVEKIEENNSRIDLKYNVLVVGYREDPEIFKKCLDSLSELKYQENINKIYIVIDGNTNEDMYMADMSEEKLCSTVIYCQELLSSNQEYLDNYSLDDKIYCFLQPHKGKRHALYTGMKLSIKDKVDGILCTDSDTVLAPNSLYYLANMMESDDDYGAITGNVQIMNNNSSIISYLSSLRYWFACNLERGYQSFNNCVLCVSGPLGLYRIEYLEKFIDKWLNQKFLSNECTYGDDRHLSNNVLLLGKKIGYTHLAECYTDTPESILKFFNQQIRWCKSSFREIVWNIQCLGKHSLWMTIDLIYQTVYSFIVLGSLIYILFFGRVFQLMFYILTLLFFNAVKGIYAWVISKNPRFVLFTFYGVIYIFLIAPAKLYAGFTLRDISWGNSVEESSSMSKFNCLEIKHYFLIVWNLFITAGIIYNFVMNIYTLSDFIAIGCVFGYIFIVLNFIGFRI